VRAYVVPQYEWLQGFDEDSLLVGGCESVVDFFEQNIHELTSGQDTEFNTHSSHEEVVVLLPGCISPPRQERDSSFPSKSMILAVERQPCMGQSSDNRLSLCRSVIISHIEELATISLPQSKRIVIAYLHRIFPRSWREHRSINDFSSNCSRSRCLNRLSLLVLNLIMPQNQISERFQSVCSGANNRRLKLREFFS
jgi:hypothetical protein